MDKFKLKAIVNKNNGQINISLPKKKISKECLCKILKGDKIKFQLGDW